MSDLSTRDAKYAEHRIGRRLSSLCRPARPPPGWLRRRTPDSAGRPPCSLGGSSSSTPLHDRAQGSGAGAARSANRWSASGTAPPAGRRSARPRPAASGRQLDRQRHPVQSPADLAPHRGSLVGVGSPVRLRAPGRRTARPRRLLPQSRQVPRAGSHRDPPGRCFAGMLSASRLVVSTLSEGMTAAASRRDRRPR